MFILFIKPHDESYIEIKVIISKLNGAQDRWGVGMWQL